MIDWFKKKNKVVFSFDNGNSKNENNSHQKENLISKEKEITHEFGLKNELVNTAFFILKEKNTNPFFLMQNLRMGLNKINQIFDVLHEMNFLGKFNGAKSRGLLVNNIEDFYYLINKCEFKEKIKSFDISSYDFSENNISENKERGIKRTLISQQVKDDVWNRDGGKCVECGSNEKLEFDHIIPYSKGGSDTYRNIQLLCEKCNRSKSNKIG